MKVTLRAGRVSYHSTWWALGALQALHRQGDIRLSYRHSAGREPPATEVVEVAGRTVVLDCGDSSQVEDYIAGSVVLKRSYRGGYENDVRPLGLMAPYRIGGERLLPLGLASRNRSVLRAFGGRKPLMLSPFRPEPKREQVILQTRAWEPAGDLADRDQVNQGRAVAIAALQKEFGDRFVGGFMPTEYALRTFPDLVSHHSTSPSGYAKLVRESKVAVSTVGLHGSNPWKLVEYLAAGCAIASEPLLNSVREPPPIAYFSNPEECVATCADLLVEHPGAASDESLDYFEREVRPDRLLLSRLKEIAAK